MSLRYPYNAFIILLYNWANVVITSSSCRSCIIVYPFSVSSTDFFQEDRFTLWLNVMLQQHKTINSTFDVILTLSDVPDLLSLNLLSRKAYQASRFCRNFSSSCFHENEKVFDLLVFICIVVMHFALYSSSSSTFLPAQSHMKFFGYCLN